MSFACEYFSVSDLEEVAYEATYPGVNVQQEFKKMRMWLLADPRRKKKNYPKFICNWLASSHSKILEAETRELVRHELEHMKSQGFHTEMYFKR